MDTDLIQRITEAEDNPGKQVKEGAEELERIIVLRPEGTTEDIIETLSVYHRRGDLLDENYRPTLDNMLRKEKEARGALSDAFKRIVLFEVGAYIAGAYSSKLRDAPGTSDTISRILHAQIALINDVDISQTHQVFISKAHQVLVEANSGLHGKAYLPVNGRAGSSYLIDAGSVLRTCAPEKYLGGIDVGFAGRHIKFLIEQYTTYQNEVDSNPEFAEFKGKYSHLFNPPVGYLRLRSPETVDYANQLLDRFLIRRTTMDLSEVSIDGRSLNEHFGIVDRRV